MKSVEGYIDVPGGRVWYIRLGESDQTPLLVLHGGPGNTHDPLKSALEAIAEERPVIFYDQLGSGNSDGPTDPSLWRTERFVEELACVRDALNLKEVHILGHSWGTMLAASYLIHHKHSGVRSVIFSSPCLSAERWKQDADELLARLPDDVQRIIAHNEQQATTNSEAYQEAMKVYYDRYVCRLDPRPAIMTESRAKANKDIYMTMWGPSEFSPTGNLKTFDCTPQLHEISIPSLFVCGRYDEATPESTQYYQSLVPESEFHVFENSAHVSYLEETDEFVRIVRGFLNS
ncbi:amino acid amidase [Paenibacillus baekrokdamisoli]|uniref:Proline iminopeptidase n=1 Tax=Paenibacillus baekrokdamisoli TaxID=1712516 RepID=A0A3G9IQX8_9BACL|nr:proline iminopeptidase-family hydrolase [Paenibacillus baekrokdamisoli]MBB3069967.1 proline iminopeptidase [Paenibacillus baekrokdamisoli]BBH20682.1 amino acid amidase [Paenibacillus baekrokdamisoli]